MLMNGYIVSFRLMEVCFQIIPLTGLHLFVSTLICMVEIPQNLNLSKNLAI